MKLDTATIVAISVIIDFILVFLLLHAWRTRTTYPGFVIWIVGTACWSVGSMFTLMFPTLQPQFIPKILGNSLIMLHPLLLYEGIRQFYGIRRRWWGTPLNAVVVSAGIFCMLYFFYLSENVVARIIGINLVAAFLFARISIELLFYRHIRSHSMQWILSLTLLPLSALVFTRALFYIFSSSRLLTFSATLSQDTILRSILFYSIIGELVIAYSYLSLTSDRVEEELRQEKLNLLKTINVKERYMLQLQELNSEIEEQKKVQERFLDMVSHEYRTPLAIIQANIDIMELKEQRRGDAHLGSLNNIQHAVDRLLDVFEATRRRKDFNLVTLEPLLETFKVEQYLTETLAAARVFWGERFICQNDPPRNCYLYADQRQLRTVLLNLLGNAAKYSEADHLVRLQIGISEEFLEVSVLNHPTSQLPKNTEVLFQKFSRGSNSTGTGGTGQGLYIARGIVEQHAGTLNLSVNECGDVVAVMRLPLAALPEKPVSAEPIRSTHQTL